MNRHHTIVRRQKAQRSVPVAMLLWMLLASATAPLAAHVAWPTHYSEKATITVRGDELRVAMVVEIPLDQLVLAFNEHFQGVDLFAEIEKGRGDELEAQFREAQFERLARDLSLTVNGVEYQGEWRPADTPINGRASEGFFVYILEWLPPGDLNLGKTNRITVTNHLFEEKPTVFANLVATDGWQLLESSTPQPPPGANLTPGSDAELALWSQDETRRTFTVVVERAG